jgi:23S rRNA (pseudouridine1915-N3)-methyltransferase
MKLRFLWIGKTRQPAVKQLVTEYLDRIGRFAKVEVTELRDQTGAGAGRAGVIEKEGSELVERVSGDPFVIALDERGRQFDSSKLAAFVEQHRTAGTRQITFVIGGHNGLAEGVKRRADLVLSLSRMTMTHELARVVLLEQVYRAFTIIHGLPYQK